MCALLGSAPASLFIEPNPASGGRFNVWSHRGHVRANRKAFAWGVAYRLLRRINHLDRIEPKRNGLADSIPVSYQFSFYFHLLRSDLRPAASFHSGLANNYPRVAG